MLDKFRLKLTAAFSGSPIRLIAFEVDVDESEVLWHEAGANPTINPHGPEAMPKLNVFARILVGYRLRESDDLEHFRDSRNALRGKRWPKSNSALRRLGGTRTEKITGWDVGRIYDLFKVERGRLQINMLVLPWEKLEILIRPLSHGKHEVATDEQLRAIYDGIHATKGSIIHADPSMRHVLTPEQTQAITCGDDDTASDAVLGNASDVETAITIPSADDMESPETSAVSSPRSQWMVDAPASARKREVVLTAPRTLVRTDREPLALENFDKPAWASGFDRDRYGLWADLLIDTKMKPRDRATKSAADTTTSDSVAQRLRWIPPGTFTMGSPESEPGRWEDEGPQDTVTIRHGFWLMDTPVTQKLWQHVMGDNPSRFVDLDRPVEQVDWRQATAFCQTLSGLVKATIQLPTEAQWEYACRAGTSTATYAGPMNILGERNAPVLNDIAWYGGNSGRDFDLPNDFDSSEWQAKEFEHQQAGTRKVAQKLPNAWGLYDMLGNVWEWCADGKRDYETSPVVDHIEPMDDGARRAIRGGCWHALARYVRSACRGAGDPGSRLGALGFRCVWVQSP